MPSWDTRGRMEFQCDFRRSTRLKLRTSASVPLELSAKAKKRNRDIIDGGSGKTRLMLVVASGGRSMGT